MAQLFPGKKFLGIPTGKLFRRFQIKSARYLQLNRVRKSANNTETKTVQIVATSAEHAVNFDRHTYEGDVEENIYHVQNAFISAECWRERRIGPTRIL